MRYLIQLALVAALATGLVLAQSSSSSQSQQPSSGSQSQTAPSSTQPDQTQTQPSTQPSTPEKEKTEQQPSKVPQGEAPPAASSTDVESTIQQAIQKEPSLSGSNIQVKVTNKEVDLSGTVNSNDEKNTAEQIAKTNAGTRKVKNHIKVKSASTAPPK